MHIWDSCDSAITAFKQTINTSHHFERDKSQNLLFCIVFFDDVFDAKRLWMITKYSWWTTTSFWFTRWQNKWSSLVFASRIMLYSVTLSSRASCASKHLTMLPNQQGYKVVYRFTYVRIYNNSCFRERGWTKSSMMMSKEKVKNQSCLLCKSAVMRRSFLLTGFLSFFSCW